MKYIKSFNESQSTFFANPDEIHTFMESLLKGRFPYVINDDGSIDVSGSVRYSSQRYKQMPVKFRRVSGDFVIESGVHLTSLEGCPEECRSFFVDEIPITDLKGGPKIVSYEYEVWDCPLTSIEGLPQSCYSLCVSSVNDTIWDPRPLRDVDFNEIELNVDEPIHILANLFHSNVVEGDFFQRFRESLDYNYIRGTHENPQIDLFRLKEALAEFGIDVPANLEYNGTIRNYTLVDDEGRSVNFWGDLI